MTETISLDLVNLLLFTMPGFFFLRAIGYESKSELAYLVYSMFWGILLMVFVYNNVFSIDKLVPILENPYAGAVIFSLLAFIIGKGLQALKPRFPIEF